MRRPTWATRLRTRPRPSPTDAISRAQVVAAEDAAASVSGRDRVFAVGSRPVIRRIKGNGLDDDVTRAAIGAATRIFGTEVDYCLCTHDIAPDRARDVLAWACQPVEWWPVQPSDNPPLAARLQDAGCPPEHFGYWWKWFPERARPDAPEWILDGDMVITARPDWFTEWAAGSDHCRISMDDGPAGANIYGDFADLVDPGTRIYSGLASLPAGTRYMGHLEDVLDLRPLERPHDGRRDMDEQGVIAATFQRLRAQPFPLSQFPFARAYEADLDFGRRGDRGEVWGYHFGNAFRLANPHFDRLAADGTVYSRDEPSVRERFAWLGNAGQWGVPGWSLEDACTDFILDAATSHAGAEVLELGTSRGRLTAMLATLGCRVTTVDHADRGAAQNLAGMGVTVVRDSARAFLRSSGPRFPLVVVDLHDNSEEVWTELVPALLGVLTPDARLIVNNALLWQLPEWSEETGVRWLLDNLPPGLTIASRLDVVPGVIVLRYAG